MLRKFVNDNLNSRLSEKLPNGMWEIKWVSPLFKGLKPDLTIQNNDRVLVKGNGVWQLFGTDGKQINTERFNNSDIVIDTANNFIYCDTENGVTAYNLSDGKLAFILSDIYGINYNRSFISRDDNKFIVLSNEIEPHPHSDYEPENSYIEIQNLGGIQIDYLGFLKSAKREKIYELPDDQVIMAKNDDNIVVSYTGKIELLDKDFKATPLYENNFTTLSISLDEDQNIYLIILTENGIKELHVITFSGNEIFKSEIPLTDENYPPVLGYNGNIYLIIKNKIQVYNPEKGLVWEKSTGNIRGCLMLADNHLLVSEDKYIIAFDPEGERKFVFMFENEFPVTEPFLSSDGEIFVATQRNLYCLRIKE